MSNEEKSTPLDNLATMVGTLITEIQPKLRSMHTIQERTTRKILEQTIMLEEIAESGEIVDEILENHRRAIKFLLEHNTVGNEPEYLELLELFGVAHYDGGVETKRDVVTHGGGGKIKNKKRRKKTRKKRK